MRKNTILALLASPAMADHVNVTMDDDFYTCYNKPVSSDANDGTVTL
jgi:hypothetical protein